ncbi:MAG: hypothetical protein V1838_02540 [Patescibacteria group bacterium]
MELRAYITIIRKSLIWLIIVTLLTGAVGFIMAFASATKYDTSLAFSINRINKQETADYQFDGYYAIQASDLFTQTVTSWLATPSVLLEIYQTAAIDPQIRSLSSFSSRFTTKKYSSQNIGINFKERDEITAEKISAAIITVLQEKTATINQTADAKSLFAIVGSPPVIVMTKPVIWQWTVVGLVAGFLLALIFIYIVYYLREPVRENEDRD